MTHTSTPLTAAGLAIFLSFSSSAWADEQEHQGSPFVSKASHGVANIVTGMIEIPKNVTNITHDSNIFAGMTVGLLRGVVHGVSRTLIGVADLVSSPFAKHLYVSPGYGWERFSEDTRYFGRHYPLYWTTLGPLDEGKDLHPE